MGLGDGLSSIPLVPLHFASAAAAPMIRHGGELNRASVQLIASSFTRKTFASLQLTVSIGVSHYISQQMHHDMQQHTGSKAVLG